MRSVFIAVLLVALISVSGQTQDMSYVWVRLHMDTLLAGEWVTASILDASRYLIVAGNLDAKFGVLKYNTWGELVWATTITPDVSRRDFPKAVAVDPLSNIYVTGFSDSVNLPTVIRGIVTAKFYSNGDTAWVRRLDLPGSTQEFVSALTLGPAGDIYIAGQLTDTAGLPAWALIKYRNDGQLAWTRQYRETATVSGSVQSVRVAPDGGICVAGTTATAVGKDDITVLKYDSSGTLQWVITYDSPNHRSDTTAATAVDGSGNLYVAGWSQVNGDLTDTDLLLLKIAPDGSIAWVHSYDGPYHGEEGAADMALDPAGNLIVVGKTYSGPGRYMDYYAAKYTPNGQLVWSTALDGGLHLHDEASDLAVDGVGNAYITGFSQTAGNCWSFYTVKLYRSGSEAWSMHYGGSAGKCHYDPHIQVDDLGGVFVTGNEADMEIFTMSRIVTIKYQQNLCCWGRTGNIDWDGRGLADLSDLTLLITYLFGSPTPAIPCREEAILDGLTDITVTDLQLLAEYLFNQGPGVLPFCP